MLKLVYYSDDTVIHEEEVPIEEIDSAIGEVIDQDYSAYTDETGDEFDGLIALKLDDRGSLVWQASYGDRGFDFDAMKADIDPRIQEAMKVLIEYGGSY